MSEIIVSSTRDVTNENTRTFEERAKELDMIEQREREAREREKKSTYKNFAQLNRDNITHMIACAAENPQALRLLLFIMENMDKYNALVCSYTVFQERLEISQATVARAIKYLKEHGFIVILRSGSSNVYVLNDNLAWANYGNMHKYCMFPANVILSSSENPQKTKYVNTKIMGGFSQDTEEE